MAQQSPLIQSSLIQYQIISIRCIQIFIWIHISLYSLIDTSHLFYIPLDPWVISWEIRHFFCLKTLLRNVKASEKKFLDML